MILVYVLLNWFTKALTLLLKVSGRGRGTALPGLIIEKYFSFAVPYILDKSPYTILITGTNGKTTTRTIIANILQNNGGVIQNRSGSNLLRGIISEILSQSNFWGEVSAKYAVFEVEEATIPRLTKLLKPEQIIVTNLYRDQLDAYGEIDRTQKFIQEAIDDSPQSTIILNGDDPRVRDLNTKNNKSTHYFQIDDPLKQNFNYEGELAQEAIEGALVAHDLKINADLSTDFSYAVNKGSLKQKPGKPADNHDLGNAIYKVNLKLPGYYHVYNAIAAISCAKLLEIKDEKIVSAIEHTKPAFGRGEIINFKNKNIHLLLVKNPVGFNLNLDLLKNISNPEIALVLNDQTADGKDVSWIWDSQLEILNEIKPKTILCSGIRADDMLMRVKYALPNLQPTDKKGVYLDSKTNTRVLLVRDLASVLDVIGKSQSVTFYILATYTAMLELRKISTGNSLNV